MKHYRSNTTVALLALTMMSAPVTAQTISTYNPQAITGWTAVGVGWFRQAGQVFTSPGTQITSMSFWLGGSLGANWGNNGLENTGAVLRPKIMAWTGLAVTGDVLFEGAEFTVQGLTEFTRYDFNTGSTALTNGQVYVAFLEAVDDGTHFGNVLLLQGPAPGTAGAVATNIGGSSDPITSTWMSPSGLTNYDGAFEATFEGGEESATPEPGSLVLIATGLGVVVSVARRRSKQPAA